MTDDEKAFADWTAAGNGVPLQYKGREHVWDRKVDARMKKGGEVHMDEGGAAFYPRVGNIKAKNFKSAKPMPFVEDPRAMDLPMYGDVDLSIPTRENLEMARRMAQRDADLKRQREGDRSPLEKLAGGVQAGRFLGSALTQGINAMPTRIARGDEAADKFIQERLYKPDQPTAYEYAGDVGDFLEKLETEYKIPPVLPEAMALQYLTGPAASQAKKAAGKGAQALEKRLDPLVTKALERGGLQRDLLLDLGQQANVIKPKGGNWLTGSIEKNLKGLKRGEAATPQEVAESRAYLDNARATWGPENQRQVDRMEQEFELLRGNDALNNWVDRNLTNYVKKEMATPEDPVRKLAEEGIIHIPTDQVGMNRYKAPENRRMYGGEQMGKSEAAQAWEDASDVAIYPGTVGEIKRVKELGGPGANKYEPWMEKADPKTIVSRTTTNFNAQDLGFDHIMDVLREDLATGRIRPEQLSKVSITDAVRRTAQYDQELAKKMNESRAAARADLPVYKDYPEGYKWIELNKPGSFANESEAMGHSVRGYEPPKGHPDWVEGSGDSGSSSYGHGGWEAIKSGKAKVYSLVGPKGEPHTTVEVGRGEHPIGYSFKGSGDQFPDTFEYNRNYDEGYSRPTPEQKQAILSRAKELRSENPKRERMDVFQSAADEILGTLPAKITQIKGKQNRAPNEEYLPYVQDFVKGGQWSDVGDLGNTGLKRYKGNDGMKYVTPEEYDVELKKELGLLPPEEGMARGGEVHMAGGGAAIKAALAKLGKFATEADLAAIKEAGRIAHEQEAFIRAAKNADVEKRLQSMPPRSKAANLEMGMYHPVGGGLKLAKPFEALHSTRVPNPKVNKPDVKILTPEYIYQQRAGLFPLIGDKADTGTFLTHIGEKELEVPVGLGGGPRYMDANYNIEIPSKSAAWESGTGRTTSLGNQAQRIAESDRPAFGVYTAGSGTNTDFNIMGANAVLQQLGQSKLTKKAEKAFDKAMREEGTKAFPPIPDWPGIRSPQLEDMLLDKSNGILRTKLFDTMGKENFQSMGFPDVPATRKAIMDPQLYDTPTHEAGFRIARMDPTGRIVEDPLHPSDYPTAMAGELEGQLDMGADYKDVFSTHFANRRLLSQPESGDYYSFSRAHPIQYADQEWLDKIMKAQEAKDKLIKTGKYAEGGEVHMQAGGLSKLLKSALKKAPQEMALKVLSAAERDAGLAKFLAPSAEKRRMYHGSKEPNIKEFKTRKEMTDESGMTGHYADERDAVFLSPEPQFTTHFSKEGYTDTHQAPTTYPVYTQVEKPFDFDNPEHLKKVKETYKDMYHNPESEFYDPHMLPSERSTALHVFNKRVDNLPNDENNWVRIEGKDFQDVIKDLGFDSFYTRERGTKNLGIYDPSKIKSAIGNRGTFDVTKGDINEAHGGAIYMPKEKKKARGGLSSIK